MYNKVIIIKIRSFFSHAILFLNLETDVRDQIFGEADKKINLGLRAPDKKE